MTVTMPTMDELRVMGTAIFRMLARMLPALSGRSVPRMSSRPRDRRKSSTIYARATTVPTVTPVMAPAAATSGSLPCFTSQKASPRPTTSLHRASMIWETEVGAMLLWPWE